MIAIVDTGGANLASVRFALARLGRKAELTSDPEVIRAAQHVILPGVGAALDAMRRLQASGLTQLIPALEQPVLGICLGMQLLFEHSDEGDAACLGVLEGSVRALTPDPEAQVFVPHMGWNTVELARESRLLDAAQQFYFVHSYVVPDGKWASGVTEHGVRFPAMIEHENFFGVQFHPERSGTAGAALLERFLQQ